MADFHGIGNGGDARRAHLALVQGGGSISTNATGPSRAAALAVVEGVQPAAPARPGAATSYAAAAAVEAPRSRSEAGVRAVARTYPNFEEALLPMVLASGVSGEAAATVAATIRSNPALKAQAERAFQRARLDAV